MRPIKLGANQPPDRFYRGGERIAQFRGGQAVTSGASRMRVPEDWVGSTTTLFAEESLGLSSLPSGELLRTAVEAEPEAWLGPDHVARLGTDTGLLVKLLDAGERLPIHVHPNHAFASANLGLAHGKTEAWIALTAGTVGLGFNRDVRAEELAGWVAEQRAAEMAQAMHSLAIAPGDAVLVPAGTPHAIGAGCFVVELQEPTDLSIMLEWDGFELDGERDGHLGLGFSQALQAVDRRAKTLDEVHTLRQSTSTSRGPLLPGAGEFFRANRVHNGGGWPAGFAVVVVVRGTGTLRTSAGVDQVRGGETLVVPFACGDVSFAGDGELVVCRPPRP